MLNCCENEDKAVEEIKEIGKDYCKAVIKELMLFIKDINDNLEHDEYTRQHRPKSYGATCYVCEAERLMNRFKRFLN